MPTTYIIYNTYYVYNIHFFWIMRLQYEKEKLADCVKMNLVYLLTPGGIILALKPYILMIDKFDLASYFWLIHYKSL